MFGIVIAHLLIYTEFTNLLKTEAKTQYSKTFNYVYLYEGFIYGN